MIRSIRFKLFMVFIILLIVFLSIFLVTNSFFLDDIFISGNKMLMTRMYSAFKEEVDKGADIETVIHELSNEFGGNITLVDSEIRVTASTSTFRVRDRFARVPPHIIRAIRNFNRITEEQSIFAVLAQDNIRLKSMVFIGKLPDKSFFIVEKPLGTVYESSMIAGRFIIISGVGTLILGSVIVFFLAGRLTRPIIRINDVVREIANLNFNEKVQIISKDEIGVLASGINLISDKLSQSLSELKEANVILQKDIERERSLEKMRRRFVSSVSHELKTPISMIQGYADGLKFNIAKSPEDMKYYCDVITDESTKMSRLIKDLLDLSSYESGTFTITKSPFDIVKLIKETTEKYKKIFIDRNIELNAELPESAAINADKMRMEQVLSNFIENAGKHVRENGSIDILLEKRTNSIYLSVYNTGEAIPPSEMENIWTSFYKIYSGKSSGNDGTGLGLAIVRAIIILHEGRYGVENVNEGVRFWFEIPVGV